MCLSIVAKRYPKPYRREGKAYKVMEVLNGSLRFTYYSNKALPKTRQILPKDMLAARGKWLKSIEKSISYGIITTGAKKGHYRSGFHLYDPQEYTKLKMMEDAAQANDFKVVEVRWRGLKYEGLQGDYKVLVVDEIFIPREKK